MRHRKTGGWTKFKRKTKYYSVICAKELGKGSRQKPSLWCNFCCGFDFKSSGFQQVADIKKRFRHSFFWKCSLTRTLVDLTAESLAYSKRHSVYTSCKNPAARAGRSVLKKASKCTYRPANNSSSPNENYTKIRQTRNHSLGWRARFFYLMKFRPLIWI